MSRGLARDLQIGVHVDDGILVCNSREQKQKVFAGLSKHFKLKDIGFPRSLLGCQYEQTPQGIRMHQTEYVQELLTRCDFGELQPCQDASSCRSYDDRGSQANPAGQVRLLT